MKVDGTVPIIPAMERIRCARKQFNDDNSVMKKAAQDLFNQRRTTATSLMFR